jgi:serine phosphatase RsbU (regulator of sigma subunit)
MRRNREKIEVLDEEDSRVLLNAAALSDPPVAADADLLRSLADSLGNAFSHYAIYLKRPESPDFELFLFRHPQPELQRKLTEEGRDAARETRWIREAAHHRRTFILSDLEASRETLTSVECELLDALSLRSLLAEPITLNGETVGAFVAGSLKGERALGEEDARTARLCAHLIEQALLNLRLQAPAHLAQRRNEAQNRLVQLTRAISQTLDLSEVLRMVCEAIVETLGYDRASVFIVDSQIHEIRGVWGTNLNGELESISHRIFSISDPGPIGRIVRREIPYLHMPIASPFSESLVVDENSGGDLVCLPFVANDEVVGILSVDTYRKRRTITDSDLIRIQPFCEEAAVAIRNARLHDELQRKVQSLQTLQDIGNEVRETMDPETVLLTLVARTLESFHVSESSVFLYDPSLDLLVWRCGVKNMIGQTSRMEFQPLPTINRTEGPILFRSLEEERVILSGGPEDPAYNEIERDWAKRNDVRSMAMIPLYTDGGRYGLLTLLQYGRFRYFSKEELFFLQSLASQATVALQKAQLLVEAESALKRSNEVNLNLRRAFVPDLPLEAKGLEIGHVFEPASREIRLGGDFYDLFQLGRYRYGFVMGDVAGHDLDAAVQTAAAKYFLRAYAEGSQNTGMVVRRLNEALLNQFLQPSLISLFYGILDLKANALFYANAGHEPPQLFIPDAETEEFGGYRPRILEGSDPLLAIDHSIQFTERRADFPSGSTLVLYTDGLTEARHQGEFLFTEGVTDRIPRNLNRSAQDIATALWDNVRASADRIQDDVAILVLRRRE